MDKVKITSDKVMIETNKKIMVMINLSDFAKLITNTNIHFYKHNRNPNDEHINDIYKSIVKKYNKNIPIEFYNSIKFCKVNNKPDLYLIDGQHRYSALKKFLSENIIKLDDNSVFIIDIYKVDKEIDMYNIFKIINTTLPINSEEIDNQRLIEILDGFAMKYPEYIREKTTKRPYIHYDKLKTKMRNYRIHTVIPDTDDYVNKTINLIEKINEDLSKKEYSYFGDEKNMDVMYLNASKINFYLGLDDDYKWLDILFKNLENEKKVIKNKNKYKISELLVNILKLNKEYINGVDKRIRNDILQKLSNKIKENPKKYCKKFKVEYTEEIDLKKVINDIWTTNYKKIN